MKIRVEGDIYVTEVIEAKNYKQAVKKFRKKYDEGPYMINGKEIYGICESCDKPIISKKHHLWEDNIITCDDCGGPLDDFTSNV